MSNLSTIQEPRHMDEKLVRRNRLKLIGIFAVAVMPLLAAIIMYFGGLAVPQSKTNKGNLIWPPIQLETVRLTQGVEKQLSVFEFVRSNKSWVMMMTGGAECAESCENLLHTARQVNVSMGKEMERVSRIFVGDIPFSSMREVESKYPELTTFQGSVGHIEGFYGMASEYGASPVGDQNSWQLWIVDPLGNVILQYTDQHDGYDMIDDLKRLLKLSNIG